jgi:hypothetical protein
MTVINGSPHERGKNPVTNETFVSDFVLDLYRKRKQCVAFCQRAEYTNNVCDKMVAETRKHDS